MRRGFTLYETLLTMLLLSVALAILAELFSTYTRQVHLAKAHSQRVAALTWALQSMGSELRQANAVTITGSHPCQIKISKLNPDAPRFPVVPSWDPLQPMMEVRFYLEEDRLLREFSPDSATHIHSQILDGVTDLTCTPGLVQDYQLGLVLRRGENPDRISTTVVGPAR